MRIIGIDPGSLVTGYGVIDKDGSRVCYAGGGCIRGKGSSPPSARFALIHRELLGVFDEYRPDQMAVEGLFFCRNVKTAIRLGEARGIALLAAGENGIEVFEYAPRRVKQAVLGRGGANKLQVQHMVKNLLGLDEIPRPPDVADALAIALCHAFALGGGREIPGKRSRAI